MIQHVFIAAAQHIRKWWEKNITRKTNQQNKLQCKHVALRWHAQTRDEFNLHLSGCVEQSWQSLIYNRDISFIRKTLKREEEEWTEKKFRRNNVVTFSLIRWRLLKFTHKILLKRFVQELVMSRTKIVSNLYAAVVRRRISKSNHLLRAINTTQQNIQQILHSSHIFTYACLFACYLLSIYE